MSIYSDKLAQVQVVINCRYSVAQICTRKDCSRVRLGGLEQLCKITTDFQILFLSKFSKENFQKSVQPAHACTKIFCLKISQIFWKNWGFKIFRFLSDNFSELRFILIGLSPDRISAMQIAGPFYNALRPFVASGPRLDQAWSTPTNQPPSWVYTLLRNPLHTNLSALTVEFTMPPLR